MTAAANASLMSADDYFALDLADKFAGNWRKWTSFGWSDRPSDADEWGISYFANRDSGLLDQSNAAVMSARLEPFTVADCACDSACDCADVNLTQHSCWAHGWREAIEIRVYRRDRDPADHSAEGKLTPAFRAYAAAMRSLESYGCLSDDDYSRREHEACLEAIQQAGETFFRMRDDDGPTPPDGWPGLVCTWLDDNEPRETENRDDQGASPSDEAIERAIRALEAGWGPVQDVAVRGWRLKARALKSRECPCGNYNCDVVSLATAGTMGLAFLESRERRNGKLKRPRVIHACAACFSSRVLASLREIEAKAEQARTGPLRSRCVAVASYSPDPNVPSTRLRKGAPLPAWVRLEPDGWLTDASPVHYCTAHEDCAANPALARYCAASGLSPRRKKAA